MKTEIKLELIGECLGHSASISFLNTISKNEIISTAFDKLVIIWRVFFIKFISLHSKLYLYKKKLENYTV
jgi:hypothetical protein